jgi:thiamine-monophosphate kinase
MCEESGVGAIVDVEAIPVDPTLRKFTVRPRDIRKVSSQSPLRRDREIELALHGGEDYELLFTAPANKTVPSEIGGVLVTCIGEIVRGKKMTLIQKGNQEELVPKGWEHFR